MKNKELIEVLQTLDPEKSIIIVKGKTGYGIDQIKDAEFIYIKV